jgi:molybdate transport system substrate-binding protein
LQGLKAQWASVRKFAIANPDHAPYGRAAQQALQALGLWDMVAPKLVLGDNIAQTTQFVTTGAAQAGITALPLALAPQVHALSTHVALPATLHQPLRQRTVLLHKASPQAAQLFAYLQSAAARRVLQQYGFVQENSVLPNEIGRKQLSN